MEVRAGHYEGGVHEVWPNGVRQHGAALRARWDRA
jgi:hypothetical protein